MRTFRLKSTALFFVIAILLPPSLQASSIAARHMSEARYIEIFLDCRDIRPPLMFGSANFYVFCKNGNGQEFALFSSFPREDLPPGYYRGVSLLPPECVIVNGFGKYEIKTAQGKASGPITIIKGNTSTKLPRGNLSALSQYFEQPRFKTYRVNWCMTEGAYCGKPAADLFCRKLGFGQAISWQVENVGFSENAICIGANQFCNDALRTVFKNISCL